MDNEKLKLFREDFPLLIEAGFVAVKQLDEGSATKLFKAAQILNPTSPASQLGLGYIALNKLELKEATKIFQTIVDKDPEHYLAQSLLGICYLLSKTKRKKGEQLLLEAKEKTEDPTIQNLAEVSLHWAESDLKKKDVFSFLSKEKEESS